MGIVGKSGQIKAALFGNSPEDFLFLGNAIGTSKEEFQVVSHQMPLLEDDFIISIYENHVIRLRSLTEDYEWMTFFEKDFSFINSNYQIQENDIEQISKSQEHLHLVQNKLKIPTQEDPSPITKSKELAKNRN